MKSLAKRVEDRYQSAAAMRADIERYLAGHPIQAAPPPLAPTDDIAPSAHSTQLIPAVTATGMTAAPPVRHPSAAAGATGPG